VLSSNHLIYEWIAHIYSHREGRLIMNKQFKRFIALGLTISLASVPPLSKVVEANEVSKIQEESFSLMSMGINNAMESMKGDQMAMNEFALTIIEQPDIVDLSVMENLPKHQQTMRENADIYLEKIQPEFNDLTERTKLMANYFNLYTDSFVSELEEAQADPDKEEEVKQKIAEDLQDLYGLIEAEKDEINNTHKEIEGFLVNIEEDNKEFEAGVAEAEEYVEVTLQDDVENINQLKEKMNEVNKNQFNWTRMGIAIGLTVLGIILFKTGTHIVNVAINNNQVLFGAVMGFVGVLSTMGGILLETFTLFDHFTAQSKLQEKVENSNSLVADLMNIKITENNVNALAADTDNVITSIDILKHEWDTLETNVKIMINETQNEDVNNLKVQFEMSAVEWEGTQILLETYEQIEEDPMLVEIDMGNINSELDLEEALKEASGVDEVIDISKLTEKELEELLLDLMEEDLDEAA